MFAQIVEELGAEIAEDGHRAQVRIERTRTVVAIQLLFECRGVVENIVQDIRQHLQHDDIGLGAGGGGARVELRAFQAFLLESGESCQFADQIAGGDFGNRIIHGEIDRGVDRDMSARVWG